MNTRNQLLCAWAGVGCFLLFFIGLWPIANFFPPHPPSAGANEIAAIYQEHGTRIRIGMVFLVTAATLFGPFSAVIATQTKRIEGEFSVLASTQLAMAVVNIMILMVPMLAFMTVAFRPERMAEISQLMNDFGWLFFIMPFAPAVVQFSAIGLTILSDQSPRPIYPRWVAFANFWLAFLFLPGALVPFFRQGPFAWDGLFGWWIPACDLAAWLLIMVPTTIRAIKSQAALN